MGLVYSVSAESISKEANQFFTHRKVGKGIGNPEDTGPGNRDVVVLTVDDSPEASYAVDCK